jgi:hypothetical protein
LGKKLARLNLKHQTGHGDVHLWFQAGVRGLQSKPGLGKNRPYSKITKAKKKKPKKQNWEHGSSGRAPAQQA